MAAVVAVTACGCASPERWLADHEDGYTLNMVTLVQPGHGGDAPGKWRICRLELPVGTLLQAWGYGSQTESGPRSCELRAVVQEVVDPEECRAAGVDLGEGLCARNRDENGCADAGGPVLKITAEGPVTIGLTADAGCGKGALGTVALLPGI